MSSASANGSSNASKANSRQNDSCRVIKKRGIANLYGVFRTQQDVCIEPSHVAEAQANNAAFKASSCEEILLSNQRGAEHCTFAQEEDVEDITRAAFSHCLDVQIVSH